MLQRTPKQTSDARTLEGIAITIYEVNGCDYCIAVHSYGLSSRIRHRRTNWRNLSEIHQATRREQLSLALRNRWWRNAQAYRRGTGSVRIAGYTDQQIPEIVALSIQFFFTNPVTHVVNDQTDILEIVTTKSGLTGELKIGRMLLERLRI